MKNWIELLYSSRWQWVVGFLNITGILLILSVIIMGITFVWIVASNQLSLTLKVFLGLALLFEMMAFAALYAVLAPNA